MTKEEIFEAIRTRYSSEDLDDTVHQLKSDEASRINNGGIEEQLKFLLETAGPTWLEEYFLSTAWPGV